MLFLIISILQMYPITSSIGQTELRKFYGEKKGIVSKYVFVTIEDSIVTMESYMSIKGEILCYDLLNKKLEFFNQKGCVDCKKKYLIKEWEELVSNCKTTDFVKLPQAKIKLYPMEDFTQELTAFRNFSIYYAAWHSPTLAIGDTTIKLSPLQSQRIIDKIGESDLEDLADKEDHDNFRRILELRIREYINTVLSH